MLTSQSADSARTLLRANRPLEALDELKKEVRKAPRDPRLRTFLFQMFCVFGEWDRALTQLGVAAELDPDCVPMAQTYRAVVRCEMLRERVFKGIRTPTVMGEPAEWVSRIVEANRLLAQGASAEAAQLRDAAFEAAPATAGTLNGEAFEWVADADARLGPILEVLIDGKYLWVPFDRLHEVVIEPPADLRDQVWLPAQFTWSTGGKSDGFIPTRYPGSATAGDQLAMSKMTEWREQGEWELGFGQRVLATDAAETAIMDLRRLVLTPASTPAS